MDFLLLIKAAFLGLIEGATEFLPVSSTAHLLLIGDVIGFDSGSSKAFEVVVQLGSILALCWVYRGKLFSVAWGLPRDRQAQSFTAAVLVGFLPALVIGVLAHDVIKGILFHAPEAICGMLIAGGFVILGIEAWVKHRAKAPVVTTVDRIPLGRALGVGFCQVLAMMPGVSRSGATIMGGLLIGFDRKTAAEFSFFLAIPTMLGASALDLYKLYQETGITAHDVTLISVGFVSAFISGMLVVRAVLSFINRFGYTPFAWYRIVFGCAMLGLLLLK